MSTESSLFKSATHKYKHPQLVYILLNIFKGQTTTYRKTTNDNYGSDKK